MGSGSTAAVGKILIVDDDVLVARPLDAYLQRSGYATHVAVSAEEALEQLEREAFSLVISDVDMPVMSGIELVMALDARHLAVPVVLLSARHQAAIEAVLPPSPHVRGVRQKPICPRDLLTLVGEILQP